MTDADHAWPSSADPADALTRLGYFELFLRGNDATLDEVWRRADAPERLRRLLPDVQAPALARFLAAEVLFARDPGFPASADRGVLASVYAEALRQNLTSIANPWGLPGELDGPVARHVLVLGDAALPVLAALLDNERELRYSGSKDATIGNSYRYRVKDMAASLIAAVLGLPHATPLDPHERDADIELLRRRLP
jgi:hypothetical protein